MAIIKYYHGFGLLFALNLVACNDNASPPVESGVTYEMASDRKSNISDVQYDLHFEIPEIKENPIKGNIDISFKRKINNQDIILDFTNPADQIIKVSYLDQSIQYRYENGHIVIPHKLIVDDNVNLKIQFLAGNQALNRNKDFLYALFVPNLASTAFPCFDQPNIKAKYRLSLDVPNEWVAFTNYSEISQSLDGNRKKYNFAQTLPISTYLFAFGAGQFQAITKEVDGRSMTLYHRETDQAKVTKNTSICFDLHAKSLEWLENYTGIPYPFEQFNFALIPAFQFGGMEHPGAIWYRERSLFLDDNATVNQKMGRNSLIAHETAHMWFGDLVTMDWFDDVWLKEVFANFMAAKMVNPNFPEINHDLRFLLRHQPSAYGEDRSAGSHAIQQELDNLNEASLLYGRIIYQKAPVVMKQLESIMGEDAFQNGLQEYLKTYSFGNATWDDLIAILDKRTDLDLKLWSQAWVKESGMPHVQAKLQIENKIINSYELNILNNSSGGNIWQQNATLMMGKGNTFFSKPISLFEKNNLITELENEDSPDYIIPNISEKGYGYFQLDKTSQDHLLQHVHEIKDDLVKSSAWFSLWEAFLRSDISTPEMFSTIINALPYETDVQGLSSRLGYLRTIYWGFLNQEERLGKYSTLGNTVWNLMNTTSDSGQKKLFYDTFVSIAITDSDIALLNEIWSKNIDINGLSLSESNYTTLSYALAVRGVEKSHDILNQQLSRITNPDRKAEMEFVIPALSADQGTRDIFFEKLKESNNRQKESWVLTALQYLHHPLHAETSEHYLLPSLELVQEIQKTGSIFFPQRWIGTILGGHSSQSALDIFNQFIADLPEQYPNKLKNKILMSGDMLKRKQPINLLN